MNIAARQKEKENKNTGKEEVGEKKEQATDFKETGCFTFVVAQRAAQWKKIECGECPR